ncbi:mediator of RNA polymerase II transcription subunit 30 isoform X1 [Sander lucioperca]|uniref:mediator of RNA polymerase II transcription subunit 30 isoform X1 n=1 Tax=Sander lucioperca TaxID=283035 RepID=UPI00125D2614|nr:mediator of RNA polymerase II transcription subunit 30 isoform X1 [Sander lucioperca]XP_031151758.1 mediator of RNA polymerase II transcription subunit 30 isoform X1 [Sander lucioperca]XP_035847266.1 mediator of RNA polymerase II transcription subunit 30 isoform X1 [Sander lucioperca]XP_035847267.1 mediator of RNA polymerase II transcription subunit 30 isoform X1 [Sander lucioperca]
MAASLPQKPGMAGMPSQQQHHLPPSAASAAGQQPMPPQGALREISPVFLCRIGQETVQDIVTRTMEIFQITRATQLPNGVTQSQAMYQDRFGKLQEHLRQLALLFRKLRLLYERCVEMTSDLQEGPSELLPFVGEELVSIKVEPCSSAVNQERKEVLEVFSCVFLVHLQKVRQKNQEMKVLMDQMRNLLWDVNAMLTLRK